MLFSPVCGWLWNEPFLVLRWWYRLGNGPLLHLLEVATIDTTVTQAVKTSSSSKMALQLTLRASRRTGCKRTVLGSLKRNIFPQTLQIWTHWTIMSGTPCWKNYHKLSQNPRQLMSRKSLCRLSLKSCHKNTSTRRWKTSPNAWLPAWLPVVVTSIICS